MDNLPSQIGSFNEEVKTALPKVNASEDYVTGKPHTSDSSNGFFCVISMHDGVVMHTTSSLTDSLGFPKDMWIGRSFIDFLHQKDRNTFASQIKNISAVPKVVIAHTIKSGSTMMCRIRRYRSLSTGFGVKDRTVTFLPFLLKFSFKNANEEAGKLIHLVIHATPCYSAFKVPNEVINKSRPFVIRHTADGNLDYLDPESVSYLGYLPQDVKKKDALQLYHPEDLPYLKLVYEKIVKDGSVPRSKPYRMMAQNGDFIKLETEWSSYINPWSMKLEFVIGKHYVIEGPTNPDVFQTPDVEMKEKLTEKEKNEIKGLRELIIHIMNRVLTKPAELAKQQKSKRCQDLASYIENLIEESPKVNGELGPQLQDLNSSFYERDFVMLGGISPHHDYDGNSYDQLNYKENLQRFFDSHQKDSHRLENSNTTAGENVLSLKELNPAFSKSSMVPSSGGTNESSYKSGTLAVSGNIPGTQNSFQQSRLTQSLLNKHNAEMEKELVNEHQESPTSSKGEREKASNEWRQKKTEHLARCNASFQFRPSSHDNISPLITKPQPHGIKRASKQQDTDANACKHHCVTSRHDRCQQPTTAVTTQPQPNITTTVPSSQWATSCANMNTFILGMGIPQQMSIMTPMPQMQGVPSMHGMPQMQGMLQMQGMPQMQIRGPMQSAPLMQGMPLMQSMPSMKGMPQVQGMPAMTGMFPVYCAPTPAPTIDLLPSFSHQKPNPCTNTTTQYGPAPVYGQPFVYSPMNPQKSYPMSQSMVSHPSMEYSNALGLSSSNYEEACKSILPLRPKTTAAWRYKKRAESKGASSKTDQLSGDFSCEALTRSTEPTDSTTSQDVKAKSTCTSDEAMDTRGTDTESSFYSSFYSSILRTEPSIAEESGDQKKNNTHGVGNSNFMDPCGSYYDFKLNQTKKVARRKMEPPWMENVCATSELIYKYQIPTKSVEEVLATDKQTITTMEQPLLVDEQLGQFYTDLQLQGRPVQLTLDEGITSSSSSGEESSNAGYKSKREYSKLVMIYEEDAPLPPPCSAPGASPDAPTESTS